MDEAIIDEKQATATSETAETIDNSLEAESIDADLIPLEQLPKRERAIAAIKANPELSARAIADGIGVSNYFISKLKKQLISDGVILPSQIKDKRGRLMNTENIGATRKTSLGDKVIKLLIDEDASSEDVAGLIEILRKYQRFI